MLPCDFLPLGSRRCSQQPQSYKSFRERNSTSSGLQMFNRSTAQPKLLLMQVRWTVFWWCRCCWRLNFHSQLFCGFASGGECLGAVHTLQHSSSAEEGWLTTIMSQNQPTLVKQPKWFGDICLQVLCYCSSKDSICTHIHLPKTWSLQFKKKKQTVFLGDCRQVWLVLPTQETQGLQVGLSMWKERT